MQVSFGEPADRLDGVVVVDEGECEFGAAVRGLPWQKLAMVGVPRDGMSQPRWHEVRTALAGMLRCVLVTIER